MTEDLLGEDARLRRDSRDLAHAIAEEEVERRVEIGPLRAHLLEDRIELGVEDWAVRCNLNSTITKTRL